MKSRVLNPRGIVPEREYRGLSPRPNTLKGKTVKFVYLGGGNPKDMMYIYEDFKRAVPDCNPVYHHKKTPGGWATPFSEDELQDVVSDCDAIVLGLNF
jgi:hypothetical protein